MSGRHGRAAIMVKLRQAALATWRKLSRLRRKQPKPANPPPFMHARGGGLLQSVLIAISVTSFWLAVLVLIFYRGGDPVLVAAVLATCGTTAAGALAVCYAVAEVGAANRISIMEAVGIAAKSRR